jgi:hypothetical protein
LWTNWQKDFDMRTLLIACLILFSALPRLWADDIAPLNAPENDLVASVLNGAVRLAPLTQRVWSENDLLRLSAQSDAAQATALRRLLLGQQASKAHSLSALAVLTAESEPRLAWRLYGVTSLGRDVDLVYVADTTRSLFERRPQMPWAYTAQLRAYTSLGEWRIGQSPIRWGGGYSGAMLLSDNPPPLFHVDYRTTWHLGRLLRTWRFEQLAAAFTEDGERRYLMARRLHRELSPQWEISLAEAFKASKLPYGMTAFILPFYLYQHIYTWQLYDRNDDWFNYMAEVQVQYRFNDQMFYFNLLLDDIQAPRWLTRFRYTTPRKSGVLVGYHVPLPGNGQFAVELAHTDGDPGGGVYSFKSPANRWVYRDAVLGHPVGTNRDMLWLRLDLPIASRTYLALEHVNTRRANASPEVPVGKTWKAHLHWLLHEGYSLGISWQQDISRDDHTDRWLLQVGRFF